MSDLSAGDLIFALNTMTTDPEARAVLKGAPKLEPWIADLEGLLGDLITAKESAKSAEKPKEADEEAEAEESPEGRTLDRRAEAAIRVIWWLLNLLEDLARARGDDRKGHQWARLRSYLLPNKLSLLAARWPEQTGQTIRFHSRTTEVAVTALLAGVKVAGLKWSDLTNLVKTNNQALMDHLRRAEDEDAATLLLPQARRQAISLLNAFLVVADRALPPDSEDPAVVNQRKALLGELEQRLAASVKAARGEKSPAPKEEDEPKDAEPPIEPPTEPDETAARPAEPLTEGEPA